MSSRVVASVPVILQVPLHELLSWASKVQRQELHFLAQAPVWRLDDFLSPCSYQHQVACVSDWSTSSLGPPVELRHWGNDLAMEDLVDPVGEPHPLELYADTCQYPGADPVWVPASVKCDEDDKVSTACSTTWCLSPALVNHDEDVKVASAASTTQRGNPHVRTLVLDDLVEPPRSLTWREVPHRIDVPVPHPAEEVVTVPLIFPSELERQDMVQHPLDVPVPQSEEELVTVPMKVPLSERSSTEVSARSGVEEPVPVQMQQLLSELPSTDVPVPHLVEVEQPSNDVPASSLEEGLVMVQMDQPPVEQHPIDVPVPCLVEEIVKAPKVDPLEVDECLHQRWQLSSRTSLWLLLLVKVLAACAATCKQPWPVDTTTCDLCGVPSLVTELPDFIVRPGSGGKKNLKSHREQVPSGEKNQRRLGVGLGWPLGEKKQKKFRLGGVWRLVLFLHLYILLRLLYRAIVCIVLQRMRLRCTSTWRRSSMPRCLRLMSRRLCLCPNLSPVSR
mmetsp:Transcript_59922/g.111033  ORF Transcript_59922/g.111033 Transcript_59922/m.111033 type:complete len:504 (+) Transcript_59922:145-1656(+)